MSSRWIIFIKVKKKKGIAAVKISRNDKNIFMGVYLGKRANKIRN